MIEIISNLYVGSDADFDNAKSNGYAICSCCKDGEYGHRSILKYTTHAAPKDANYYFVERGKHLALNLIDPDDPAYVPDKTVNAALAFIDKHMKAGDKVLVHCNHGHSRSPSITLLYLRTIGEMPHSFARSESVFKTLYPPYDPGHGMRQYARSHWGRVEGNI